MARSCPSRKVSSRLLGGPVIRTVLSMYIHSSKPSSAGCPSTVRRRWLRTGSLGKAGSTSTICQVSLRRSGSSVKQIAVIPGSSTVSSLSVS